MRRRASRMSAVRRASGGSADDLDPAGWNPLAGSADMATLSPGSNTDFVAPVSDAVTAKARGDAHRAM